MEFPSVAAIVEELTPDVTYAIVPLVAFILLLLWRLYRFTITPVLFPHDPKEYPYWIPIIAHLRPFFQNASKLLDKSRLYFNDTREPYALTVAGQKWYIITSPADVTSVYKINDGSLSYDIFVEEVMGMIGITQDGVKKAYRTQHADGTATKHLVGLCKEYQIAQLSPGQRLDELLIPAVEYITNQLSLNSIVKHCNQSTWGQEKVVKLRLYHLMSQTFIGFGQQVYFGKMLSQIEPDIIDLFASFDTNAWQVLYQYPKLLCGTMLKAKNRIHAALQEYLSTPVQERRDAAWMIRELEKDMNKVGVSRHDMSLFYFQLLWSICGNIKKAPFWMLSYMLFDPCLITTIREEITPALSSNGIDVDYLLNSSPRLNALWDEALRKTSFAASVRFLTKDITLPNSSLILRKGNRIMMPQRQLHYNAQVFGKDASEFRPWRFLDDPRLKRNGCYRPFGGGATYCPGRHLAKVTALVFVATLIGRFDISLDGDDQKFPLPTEGNPSIGPVDLVPGTDIQVVLKARK